MSRAGRAGPGSAAAPGAVDVQEAIDAIGFGRFQRRLLLVCDVTGAAAGAQALSIGFALPAIRADLGLDAWAAGFVAAAVFLGMLVGGVAGAGRPPHHGARTGRRSGAARAPDPDRSR